MRTLPNANRNAFLNNRYNRNARNRHAAAQSKHNNNNNNNNRFDNNNKSANNRHPYDIGLLNHDSGLSVGLATRKVTVHRSSRRRPASAFAQKKTTKNTRQSTNNKRVVDVPKVSSLNAAETWTNMFHPDPHKTDATMKRPATASPSSNRRRLQADASSPSHRRRPQSRSGSRSNSQRCPDIKVRQKSNLYIYNSARPWHTTNTFEEKKERQAAAQEARREARRTANASSFNGIMVGSLATRGGGYNTTAAYTSTLQKTQRRSKLLLAVSSIKLVDPIHGRRNGLKMLK